MKNSHRIRNGFSWATLLVVFALLCATVLVPNTAHTQDKKEKKKVFTDEDLKVEKIGGKWTLQTGPDFKQADDPSAPVVITYVNMFFGHGKYAGLVKILEAEIENRSPKRTQSIQLRWLIVSPEEPETVLLEGLIPFPEVRVEANSTARVDIPPVYFNKIVKPLLKNGEITGTFRLMVGIQEVHFADGTAWKRSQQAAFVKVGYGGSAVAQSAAAQDPERKMPFSEEDLKEKKVEGKYKFSAIPDLKQISDPAALATINRVNMSLGQGKYAGLVKIASVGVENRNHHALKSLRLKWRMVSADKPQEVLLEGSTPPFATTINPLDSKVIEIPHIFYNRVVKPLLKDNELHGNYHLVISVSDARFEDGSVWE